jgi:CRISPR-associated endonuclease/helicase Cas3
MPNEFIAHFRSYDHKKQSVYEHLTGVSDICSQLTGKIGLPDAGSLLGLLHDFGKYSEQFQRYIHSAVGLLDPDIDDEYVDVKAHQGKIDHSTAGAQWMWQRFKGFGPQGRLVGQIMAVCLASHHGGLLDCLRPDGIDGFKKRIFKEDNKTHCHECVAVSDQKITEKLEQLASESFLRNFCQQLAKIINDEKITSDLIRSFRVGFFTRFLFSCLIDADRINSADFENPGNLAFRSPMSSSVSWQIAINRFETTINELPVRNETDTIRRLISAQCKDRATESQGIYTLTVPTGGGKTFASMRYALHHAKKHNLDHIIYIIPYTSIIEQNAEAIRKILESETEDFSWVLEHHSNLEPEVQTWKSKLAAENWDAPIIFTTMVQFLEAMFGGGTRGPRRLHNIANSGVIFDEIQNIPVNCVHLFCNAIQFFSDYTKTTVLLCTATQPLLDKLKSPDKGQLNLSENHSLIKDVSDVFRKLKRVNIKNLVSQEGWTKENIGDLAIKQLTEKGNCLIVVNTKKWAQLLFEYCQDKIKNEEIVYLSTNLCPAHRKERLDAVRKRLDEKLPVLCISTQLIEAGVDVDFNAVIRFLAGFDSIAQAAGRCNRNGNLMEADVFVVNPCDEKIDMLPDIKIGRDKALRILSEKKESDDLLTPEIIRLYFFYYFYDRSDCMDYPVTVNQIGRNDTLLNLLSDNRLNTGRHNRFLELQQSFKTAGKIFKAIDAPTQAVIVPFGKGKQLIGELCAAFDPSKSFLLLRQAQKYSVNVYPETWQKLKKINAVNPIQEGEGIFYLDERFYNDAFGLSTEIVSTMDAVII